MVRWQKEVQEEVLTANDLARVLPAHMSGSPLMERESDEEGFFSIGGEGMDERGIRETEDAEDGG